MSNQPEPKDPIVPDEAQADSTAAQTAPDMEPEAKSADAPAPEVPQKKKLSGGLIAAIAAGVALLGALIFFIARGGTSGGPYALKIGDTTYSAAEVNYEYMAIYQQFASYSAYFGSVEPEDEYTLGEGDYETWGDYYRAMTIQALIQQTSLCDLAEQDGIALTDEDNEQIDAWIDNLEDLAETYGSDSLDAFIAENFGEGVTEDVLRTMAGRDLLGQKYWEHYQESLTFTDEEIAAEYEANQDDYDTFSFQYYVVDAEPDDTDSVTDEAMAAAEEKANAIVAAANGTAEGFAAAVGSDGNVESMQMTGSMITMYGVPFGEWLLDPDRTEGDMTVAVEDGYGYYVVLFEGRAFDETPTVDVRHILIQAEDADGDGDISDAELAAAKEKIEAIYAEWLDGEQTEERFAELANEYSEDPGSNTNGGLYEDVYTGQMVAEFDAFCFDPAREPGDVEIIEDETYSGYHLMYFVGTGEPYGNTLIREALADAAMEAFSAELAPEEPVEGVDYVIGSEMDKVGVPAPAETTEDETEER